MTEMMKPAVLVGPEKIETKLEPVPEMKACDIRIRVCATGVCGSDIHMWKTGKGWNPNHQGDFWMGHEFWTRARATSRSVTASSSGRTSTAANATCAAPVRNTSAAK